MLTPREREVAALVAKGFSTKAVARELGISYDTADHHIRNAASRIPVDGPPRHRLTVWFFSLKDPA